MKLYPADFRDQLGDSVEQAFRDLLRDAFRKQGHAGVIRLWFRIVPDFVFSIWQLLTSTSGDYLKWYFRLRWVLACGLGTVLGNTLVSILSASGIIAFFTSLGFPARWTFEGASVFLSIALFQSQVLTRTFCRPPRWVLLSALGGVVGVVGASFLTPYVFPQYPYFPPTWSSMGMLLLFATRAAVVGVCVGVLQWFAFRQKPISAARWGAVCMFAAYAANMVSLWLSFIGAYSGSRVLYNASGFASGCIFGVITAVPLKRILWPNAENQSAQTEMTTSD
jgi:hypothetical protein